MVCIERVLSTWLRHARINDFLIREHYFSPRRVPMEAPFDESPPNYFSVPLLSEFRRGARLGVATRPAVSKSTKICVPALETRRRDTRGFPALARRTDGSGFESGARSAHL